MRPTCKTLLELSHAPVADRMRSFIRGRIAAGDTKSQIKSKLVAEFGEGVLAAPPRSGFGLLAWVLPLAGLAAAASIIALIAQRWRRAADHPQAPLDSRLRLDRGLERRLDEELARHDDSQTLLLPQRRLRVPPLRLQARAMVCELSPRRSFGCGKRKKGPR